MKRLVTTLGLLALAATVAPPAFATNLMSETFPYSNGSLTANPLWTTFSGSGGDIQIVNGRAVGNNLNAPDDARAFTAQGTSAKLYACFGVTIPSPAAAPDTNYIAMFKDSGTSNFLSRLWVGASGTGFKFGLSATSCACNTNCVPVFWGTPLLFDHEYKITISYDGTTGIAELWVNATTQFDTKITASGGPINSINLSTFALRQSNSAPTACQVGSFAWGYSFDNLGVGTTFDDACNFGPTATQGKTWGQVKSIYR